MKKYEVQMHITVSANSPEHAVFLAANAPTGDFTAKVAEAGKANHQPVRGMRAWLTAQRDEWLGIWHFGSESEVCSTGLDPHLPTPDAIKVIGDFYNMDKLPKDAPDVQDAT